MAVKEDFSSNRFMQQRLPAWQPILTPPHVAVLFVIIAIILVPIGVAILAANNTAKEFSFGYEHVKHCTITNNDGAFSYIGNNGEVYTTGCITTVDFMLPEALKAPVYLYYGLTNFYQNHRRFATSRNDGQLAGIDTMPTSMSDADPLVSAGDVTHTRRNPITYNGVSMTYGDFVYNPVGLVAWSMFNDSFVLYHRKDSGGKLVDDLVCNGTDFSKGTNEPLGNSVTPNKCVKQGIAWDTDISHKFKPPVFEGTRVRLWTAMRSLYPQDASSSSSPDKTPVTNDTYFNNGWYASEAGHDIPVTTDEDLMVWMRAASLPRFRKLYRVIHTDLPAGPYRMVIDEHFDVSTFRGTKGFTLATLSWVGGKSTFLGAMYIAIGGASLLFAVAFYLVYRFVGDRSQLIIEQLVKK